MKKFLSMLLAVVMVLALAVPALAETKAQHGDITVSQAQPEQQAQADTAKLRGASSWDFETDPAESGFTYIDQDGDGFNWVWHQNTGTGNYTTHSGDGVMTSASYDNDNQAALTPDNWMISPVCEGTMLTFWMCGQDASYCEEYVGVYVSTDGGETWSNEIAGFTATSEMTQQAVNLSAYTGEIQFALRHYNCTDMFYLDIDDIELMSEVPQCTVTFVDGYDGTTIDTMTVEAGTVLNERDFPTPPTHEGYEFTGWDYNGASIAADTTITANYKQEGSNIWDFETDPTAQGFTFLDQDGDGNGWGRLSDAEYAHESTYAMASASYSSGALTPDNWMITPAFEAVGMSFWTRGLGYPDHVGIFVSTDGGSTWSDKALLEYDTDGTAYEKKTVDLSAYKDQEIMVAFRHYNCTDQYYVFIDDIETYNAAPEYTVTFYDIMDESVIGTITVEQGYVLTEEDFPEVPEHEGYVFYGWSYDGTGIAEDTAIIAFYSYDGVYENTLWDFEDEIHPIVTGFHTDDGNGDGNTWEWFNAPDYANSTSHMMACLSNGMDSMDDWLITPKFTGTLLTFYYRGYSASYTDHLEVYVSADDGATWKPVGEYEVTGDTYTMASIDLSEYEGTLRVGFNVSVAGGAYVFIDDIEVMSETPTYTVTFIDGLTGEPFDRPLTVEMGYVLGERDFPTPPTHEDYEFFGWDYDGSPIVADTEITAIYGYAGVYSNTIWDFETDPSAQGFLMLDEDGDGHNWEWQEPGSSYVHSTSHSMYSASYEGNGVGALSPDNWLITPKFTASMLTFWIRNYSGSYKDHLEVYVSTDNGATWSESVLSIDPANTFEQYTIDLTEYGEAELRVAFRHCNCSDKYRFYLDDIEIITLAPTAIVTFVDGVDGSEINTLEVETGYVLTEEDFPTPPEHEDWTFVEWDYDGSSILQDTTVTALYSYDKLLIWDFETDPFEQGFILLDADGDSSNWQWATSGYSGYFHEGIGYMIDKYKTDPDDYLITPAFTFNSDVCQISFWANSYSASWLEYLGVYVSTDDGETWSEEIWGQTLTNITPQEFTIDLSAYADDTIRVAFRHYNSPDKFYIFLDYITLTDATPVPLAEPHNVYFKVGNATLATLENVLEITEEDLPEGPAWYGFTFTGWDMTVEEINAALAEGDVTVNGIFVPAENAFTVTIIYGEEVTEKTFTESRWLTVKAKAQNKAGQYFQYWTMDDVIISYSPRANVRVVDTCTLEAHYADEPIEATGVAQLIKATFAGGRETFVVYLAAPNGATMTDAGLLASPATEYDPEDGELTPDNAKFYKHCNINDPSQPATYTWIKTNVQEGDVWYIRPFVTYELDGETFTVYGETTAVKAGNE